MMSRSSRSGSLHRWALVAAGLAVGTVASAEVPELARTPVRTKPTPVESMARITDNATKSTLKCWQEGRLVFESNGVSIAEGIAGSTPAFKGANGRTVQLLDLRQGLCILERSNG